MPREGDIDTTYPTKLLDIGIELQESFAGAKTHHKMKCVYCLGIWVATPISKLQTFKKYGVNGCPICNLDRQLVTKRSSREINVQKLLDRGFEVKSNWDGRRINGSDNVQTMITVTQLNCGHTFTTTAINLLSTDTTCTVCGIEQRTSNINKWSKTNSDEWKKTASRWKIYKSKVSSLSRYAYQLNKSTINPDNFPQGKAGVEGAYHLDHIVPIRYCFNNNIPEEICAHVTNLQMLGWRENVGSRDKLKSIVPSIFEQYIHK